MLVDPDSNLEEQRVQNMVSKNNTKSIKWMGQCVCPPFVWPLGPHFFAHSSVRGGGTDTGVEDQHLFTRGRQIFDIGDDGGDEVVDSDEVKVVSKWSKLSSGAGSFRSS